MRNEGVRHGKAFVLGDPTGFCFPASALTSRAPFNRLPGLSQPRINTVPPSEPCWRMRGKVLLARCLLSSEHSASVNCVHPESWVLVFPCYCHAEWTQARWSQLWFLHPIN